MRFIWLTGMPPAVGELGFASCGLFLTSGFSERKTMKGRRRRRELSEDVDTLNLFYFCLAHRDMKWTLGAKKT